MATEIIKQIDIISNKLRIIKGNKYANKYKSNALTLLKNNINIQILIEATMCFLDDDYKLTDNICITN
jgi:hypothetical protein